MKTVTLLDKTAIVTGGNGALGSVVCRILAQEGCTVYATVRPSTKPTLPAEVRPIMADVTKEEDVVSGFANVLRERKQIDILINTVGGFLPRTMLQDLPTSDWDHMMSLNLRSTFLCTREALRAMRGQSYGRIVNIAAMGGVHPTAGRAAYGISKAGVILLTDVVAQELKGTGITINAIAPYIIDTPANRASMPDENFSRWVTPESIADTIVFLCSETASSISGTVVKV